MAGLASVPLLAAAGVLDDFALGVVVAAALYLLWGLLRRRPGDERWRRWQVVAVAGFGMVTAVAVVSPDPRRNTLLAAGWLLHAAWDVVHFRADRIVPRWWSLWCVVLDAVLAGVLLTRR